VLIRIELYKPENTDYEHNGDMPLLPESASVKAILNGSWKAEIQHPIDEEGR
jgi:phage-related protein